MAVIRSFVAVLIDSELKDRISLAQGKLKQHSSTGVRWVARDNFHVTLKFLGNIDESDLPSIEAALVSAVSDLEPFEIEMAGLGAFPNWRKAQVLWAGVREGADSLAGLAQKVDAELSRIGLVPEKGRFRAHITIGRVKDTPIARLEEAAQECEQEDLGSMRVSYIALMRSDIMSKGPVYTVLRTIDLGSNADK